MELSKEHDKAKKCAIERAEEVQANLNPQFPSFVKSMLHSHVTGGFWLGLPGEFCKLYLPKQDSAMTLVDEDQKQYTTKFLVEKTGLSAGWRGFSISHHLIEGDTLIFQLVADTKFQVLIIRAYSLGALYSARGIGTSLGTHKTNERTAKKGRKTILMDKLDVQESMKLKPRTVNIGKFKPKGRSSRKRRQSFQLNFLQPSKEDRLSSSNSEVVDSEVPEGVKDVENVTITVNGVVIDPEISMEVKRKYCQLCSSQGSVLHNNLVAGLSTKFVAGAISETVEIAESIEASKFNTFQKDFATWETRLGAVEHIGMNVDFLRARLHRLKEIALLWDVDSKEYCEAKAQQVQVKTEVQMLKEKLVELEKRSDIFDSKTRRHEQRFHSEATSPW